MKDERVKQISNFLLRIKSTNYIFMMQLDNIYNYDAIDHRRQLWTMSLM